MKEEQVCQECEGERFLIEGDGRAVPCPYCAKRAPQSVPVDEGVEA
jgi:hypothetical protein